MPSPFPGMDPYLENPDWFPNLHHDPIFGENRQQNISFRRVRRPPARSVRTA